MSVPVPPPFSFGSRTNTSAQLRETVKHVNNLSSRVTQIYTSQKNIDIVQDAIRYQVWIKSGKRHVIARQSDSELAIVMRSILLQFGDNNDDNDVLKQVRALNDHVIRYCVSTVLENMDSYMKYRRDTAGPLDPLARAQPSSIKGMGERSLQYGGTQFL